MHISDIEFSEDQGYFCLSVVNENDISFVMQAFDR